MTMQPALASMPVAGFSPVETAEANGLLIRWGHYLGPCNRPFGVEAWVLDLEGVPIAVAVGASIVSSTVSGYDRQEVVELARLCSDPAERWATRVALRLWREIGAPRWTYWPVKALVAYSANARHEGDIYRFDGWKKVADNCGSLGGGTWSTRRQYGDAVLGSKRLWMWSYG